MIVQENHQQLSKWNKVVSDKDIKNKYECINTITFGSLLINGFKREGVVKRILDTSYVVPYMSISLALNIVQQASGLNREDGGYKLDLTFTKAHCKSYNHLTKNSYYGLLIQTIVTVFFNIFKRKISQKYFWRKLRNLFSLVFNIVKR